MFERFLTSEQGLFSEIHQYKGCVTVDQNALLFTLPALKKFVDKGDLVDYIAFRKVLYSNDTNEMLAKWGGKVVIEESKKSINTTVYKLIHDVEHSGSRCA